MTSVSDLLERSVMLTETVYGQIGVALTAALIASVVLTPLMIRVARRFGWVDQPKADRWHRRPVALMGGIAIVAAGGIGVLLSGAYMAFPWPIWVGALLMFASGWADDRWTVPPEAKVAVQILSTILILYAGFAFWRGGPFWVSVPLTFLWVIGIINAFNLIDGLDGLAAGLATIGAGVLGLIAFKTGDPGIAVVAAALAGASGGFLFFNFQPASIFMGDCGSMALGYMLAVLSMSVQGSGGPVVGTLVPVLVLAVPIFDTTFVTVTRILSNRSVSEGGTDHTHHRLAFLGLSERGTVLTLHGVSLVLGVLALSVRGADLPMFIATGLLVVVAAAVFGVYLARAEEYGDQAGRLRVSSPWLRSATAVLRTLTGAGNSWKSVLGMVADLLLIGASFIAAHHLRFGGSPPEAVGEMMMTAIPAVIGLKVAVFYVFRLYKGIWRHAGTPELLRLLGASTMASLLTYAGLLIAFGPEPVSDAAMLIDGLLTTMTVAGVRFGFRGLHQFFVAQGEGRRKALIYGTEEDSLLALRYLRRRAASVGRERTIVGLIDDDEDMQSLSVQGVSVLGTLDDLGSVCSEHDVDELIVPTETVPKAHQSSILTACRQCDVRCLRFASLLQPISDEPGEAMSDGGVRDLGPLAEGTASAAVQES
jgi:UDP-GlcNAc:undecaprenyl-phosphate GlcNAc-1-phosphate transferase